jgi:hypothetical protein
MKKHLTNAIPAIFAILAFAACSKGGGEGGGGLIGGGGDEGGGKNTALVGKWTSVSATGTVVYTTDLGASLAGLVNQDMATYDLTGVSVLEFEANGKMSLYDLGELFAQGTWSVNGTTVKMTNADNESISFTAPTGNEFTISGDSAVAFLIAWAIGEFELKNNNYQGMFENGVQVSTATLDVKYKKQ